MNKEEIAKRKIKKMLTGLILGMALGLIIGLIFGKFSFVAFIILCFLVGFWGSLYLPELIEKISKEG